MDYRVTGLFHRALWSPKRICRPVISVKMKMSLSELVPFVSLFTPNVTTTSFTRCVYRCSGCWRTQLRRSAASHPLLHLPAPLHLPLQHPLELVLRPLAYLDLAASRLHSSGTSVHSAAIPAWISLKRSNENHINFWYQYIRIFQTDVKRQRRREIFCIDIAT